MAAIPAIRRRGPGAGVPLAVAACGLAGLALGASEGRRAASGCLAALRTGDRVVARGFASRPLSGGRGVGTEADGASSLRLDLHRVDLSAGGRRCRVSRLVTRVRPPGRAVPAGSRVGTAGRWWAYDPGAGPVRPPSGYGMIRGRLLEPGRASSRGAHAGAGGPGSPLPLVPGDAGPRPGVAVRLRIAAARRLAARLPAEAVPMARALVLADRSGLPPALRRRFADAGLAHLLAISGLHVGILAAGALWLVGRLVRRPARYLVAAALVAGYVVVIGAPAAATRAAVLFAGWAVGRSRGAPIRVTELLGVAAAVSVLADPVGVLGPGFQLSFAGFSGLILGGALADRALEAGPLSRRRPAPRIRRGVTAAGAGTGAVLATAPLAALHFQHTAPVAVITNFAGVPLVTLALAGIAGALLLPGPLAGLVGAGAALALRGLREVVDAAAGLPFGHGPATPPGPLFWGSAALVLGAAVHLARGGRPARAALPAGAGLALWVAAPGLLGLGASDTLVCQLDVGQGDAAAVRTRAGRWLVFDAGPRTGSRDAGRRVVSPFLRDRGATSVALLVLTHPDMDHLGGTDALLADFRVDRVLDAGNPVAREPYLRFLDGVAEEGARWIPARPGARHRIDEVEVVVLAPGLGGPELRDGAPRDANGSGVAVRVRVGDQGVYVNTGDAPRAGERAILARWPPDSLRTILLKVGHHGSRTSTGRAWLEATRPAVAVISSGAGNRYGHPHPGTLRRLRASGVPRLWRTDRDGTLCVSVRPDGRWRIDGEPGWRPPRRRPVPARASSSDDPNHGGPRWTDPS